MTSSLRIVPTAVAEPQAPRPVVKSRARTRKLWRQKGTGRARAGTTKNPVWRGGGIVFGPRPRSYAKTVNKGTRKLALRKVLGDLIGAECVISVPSFSIKDGKTKSFVAAIKAITDARKRARRCRKLR